MLRHHSVIAILIVVLNASSLFADDIVEEVVETFQGSFDEIALALEGLNDKKYIQQEAAGLRIVILPADHRISQKGLRTRFRVRGDFEITLRYEILRAIPPQKGYGAGILLALSGDKGQGEYLFGRANRPDKGAVWSRNHVTQTAKGKPKYDTRFFPANSATGSLRLVRVGDEVSYQAAESATARFQELERIKFSGDVPFVRVVADPGGLRGLIDVRLQELHIISREPPVASSRASRFWSTVALFGGLCFGLTLVVLLGLWYWRLHNTPPGQGTKETIHSRIH